MMKQDRFFGIDLPKRPPRQHGAWTLRAGTESKQEQLFWPERKQRHRDEVACGHSGWKLNLPT